MKPIGQYSKGIIGVMKFEKFLPFVTLFYSFMKFYYLQLK